MTLPIDPKQIQSTMMYHLSHSANHLLSTSQLPPARCSMDHLALRQLENMGASARCLWSYSLSRGRLLRWPPTISCCPKTLHCHVNPGEGAIWEENLTRIHGLHPYHVWAELNHFIGCHMPPKNFPIIPVAYHGKSCDLKWIWKLTQAPRSTLSLHS